MQYDAVYCNLRGVGYGVCVLCCEYITLNRARTCIVLHCTTER